MILGAMLGVLVSLMLLLMLFCVHGDESVLF